MGRTPARYAHIDCTAHLEIRSPREILVALCISRLSPGKETGPPMTTWPQSTSLASSPSDLNFAETGLREFTPASRTSCLGLRKLSGKITNQVVSHTEGKVTTKIGDQKRNQGYMWSQKFGIIKKIICRDFEPHTRLRCQVITKTLSQQRQYLLLDSVYYTI